MSEHATERSSLLPPHHTELARYAPVRALGTGGMAETFVARSVDPKRPELVCLKRLRAALASDPVQRAHFADEARVLARLCHPNVLCVLDAGVDLEGPFLVTELVEGLDLRRMLGWLAELGEPMPEPIALRIAHELAEALAHAHAHGVVHRDVTPANVLLGRDGRVVLIDFGIARSDAQTQRTRTGLVKGKAAYMAPEQALGAGLDARTDLFALGVMLFEMLAGARPHDGASDVETVTNALRARRRPLARPLATSGLEALIESLLHPQAARRPADAAIVLRALEATTMANVGELGAWVRTACETAGGERVAARESGTRRSARVRAPETSTIPEQQIHTSEIAPDALDVLERTRGVDETLFDARVADWQPELDPPTTIDAAPLGEETVMTPRFEIAGLDEAPRTEARRTRDYEVHVPSVATAPSRGNAVGMPGIPASTSPASTRPRRLVMFLRGGAMLAGGLVAGAITGGSVALLLRCVM